MLASQPYLGTKGQLRTEQSRLCLMMRILYGRTETGPSPPMDGPVEPMSSEDVTLGIMIGTATELHSKFCHAHQRGRPSGLYRAI